EAPADKAARHALLVGATHYPNLDRKFQLAGPANDVLLMRQVLTEQFAFPEGNVTTLSEQEGNSRSEKDGKEAGEKHYPTRANVAREFARLAKAARPGDFVFILLG